MKLLLFTIYLVLVCYSNSEFPQDVFGSEIMYHSSKLYNGKYGFVFYEDHLGLIPYDNNLVNECFIPYTKSKTEQSSANVNFLFEKEGNFYNIPYSRINKIDFVNETIQHEQPEQKPTPEEEVSTEPQPGHILEAVHKASISKKQKSKNLSSVAGELPKHEKLISVIEETTRDIYIYFNDNTIIKIFDVVNLNPLLRDKIIGAFKSLEKSIMPLYIRIGKIAFYS
jgi:hypothetical protein